MYIEEVVNQAKNEQGGMNKMEEKTKDLLVTFGCAIVFFICGSLVLFWGMGELTKGITAADQAVNALAIVGYYTFIMWYLGSAMFSYQGLRILLSRKSEVK